MTYYTNVDTFGNAVLLREIENGKKVNKKVKDYSPSFYIPSNKPSTDFKSIDGRNIEKTTFSDIKTAKTFLETYENVENFHIYGHDKFYVQFINDVYKTDIKWDIADLDIATLDIETTSDTFPNPHTVTEEILLITVKVKDAIYTFGSKPYNGSNKKVQYFECQNERQLLETFIDKWKEIAPHIITGWNVKFFDIPYLINRIIRIFDQDYAKQFSPWSIIQERSENIMGRDQVYYRIYGVAVLDYMDLYKKFTYKQRESYKLDFIANVELNERKVSHDEHDSMKSFYKNDWDKFVDYNINDVILVDKLEKKMKLIRLCCRMAYDAKANFEDVFSQVRTWDCIIYNYLYEKKIIPRITKSQVKGSQFEGAYVKSPVPGMYKWVISFDVTSLYPSLIMTLNISPETYNNDKTKIELSDLLNKSYDTSRYINNNAILAANGVSFNKNVKGFLPEITEKIFGERIFYKKKMNEFEKEYNKTKDETLVDQIAECKIIQEARKIQLNSLFGAIGNPYCRYYNINMAEAITITGQLTITWIEKSMNEYFNKLLKTNDVDYVIAVDTDSNYVCLDKLIEELFKDQSDTQKVVDFIDNFCQKMLEPYIEKKFTELNEYLNSFSGKLKMKREVIASPGIWTAKKRYALNVWDSEGVRYTKPKSKIMGIEVKRSSTPEVCRNDLEMAISIILNKSKQDLIDFIDVTKKKFTSLPVEDIAFPRGCNGVDEYSDEETIYSKGCPIHVRGSLLYNQKLVSLGLETRYSKIGNGDKIKYVYLKVPNPIFENIISFSSSLPKEFELHNYIDYDLQFEKAFLAPLNSILNAIDWNIDDSPMLPFLQ